MSKSKEKFLAALQEIEEYKDIAISRLDLFYSVVAENFLQFDIKIDDEAKKKISKGMYIDKKQTKTCCFRKKSAL